MTSIDVDALLEESFENRKDKPAVNKDLNKQDEKTTHLSDIKEKKRKKQNGSASSRSPSRSRHSSSSPRRRSHKKRSKSRSRSRSRRRSGHKSKGRDHDRDRRRDRDRDRHRERVISDREKERDVERKKREEERRKEIEHDQKIQEYLDSLNEEEAAALERERAMLSVLVTLLPPKLRNRELMEFFEENNCGLVRDARIIADRNTRKSKGYAYVEFLTKESVNAAIALTGQKLNGKRIVVQYSHAEKNTQSNQISTVGPKRIYVGNLNPNLDETHVAKIFTVFGEVDQVNLIRDKETTQSTGSAFVTFKKSESAQIAIEALNGQLFQGRPLKVTWPVKSDLKEREGLDDSSNVGVQMNAAQVTQLMTKYSASKDLANSAHTVPFVPVPSSFAPAVPVLTNCICLSNMFDLNCPLEEDWEVDLKDDVTSEAEKYGKLLHIYVDKSSLEGHVYLKFATTESAMNASKAMDGRFFDGRVIKVEYLQPQQYSAKFPGQ